MRGHPAVLGHGEPDREQQIGVFLAYASAKVRALIDRSLYLPKEKEWTDDLCARKRMFPPMWGSRALSSILCQWRGWDISQPVPFTEIAAWMRF